MNGVGRKEDQEAGRRLMQTLEAETLRKRQSWYADALPMFAADGTITQEQAEKVREYIGLPDADVMRLETPYAKAKKAGILRDAQARKMDGYIFEKAHSGTALCSGTAANHYTQDAVICGGSFYTDKRDDSVFKVSGGAAVSLKNVRIEKSGDTTDHSEGSFTGLNAAVLAEGGSFRIEDSEIISHAIGGNNVFAHGEGSRVLLRNVLLDAYGAASNRCVYVSFGGEVEAEGCEFTSRGSISSTIATDTGGGTIRLKDCLVKTLGGHCASLYSTGHIEAEHCVCVAPETEGLIIVGDNTMDLKDTVVLSGQGQGVKFSGGMEADPGRFSMSGGALTVCEGPVVSAQGAAEVVLERVAIANPEGKAVLGTPPMRMPGMPAPSADSSARIHVLLRRQTLSGEISGDSSHEILVEAAEKSELKISVPEGNQAPVHIRLSADSRLTLLADTALASLENKDPSGGNVDPQGFRLTILEG